MILLKLQKIIDSVARKGMQFAANKWLRRYLMGVGILTTLLALIAIVGISWEAFPSEEKTYREMRWKAHDQSMKILAELEEQFRQKNCKSMPEDLRKDLWKKTKAEQDHLVEQRIQELKQKK